MKIRIKSVKLLYIAISFCLLNIVSGVSEASQLYDIKIIDKDHIMLHFKDGDVLFVDDGSGPTAFGGHTHEPRLNYLVHYGDPLNLELAMVNTSWTIHSSDDNNYSSSDNHPVAIFRKSKLNGHAEFEWVQADNDFRYEHTMEHYIFLKLPFSLQDQATYTLQLLPAINSDSNIIEVTFDIFHSISEAIKVNLVGYTTENAVKAADLYMWMGDGGARDYSAFEGNTVYIFNVDTEEATEVGTVSFWKNSQGEAQGYNLTLSDVWNVDFTGFNQPGIYRLAVEGVGSSQNFEIREDIYFEPFRVSTLGFFYMRIGADSIGIRPVPRRPLFIPDQDPSGFRVIITDMHPYQPQWAGGGDRWDQPQWFSQFALDGNPENPYAYGGHSDALDWDRHLGHVSIIWDMLLPYILTNGALYHDDLGIAESGNGIPDIIDEARDEVDFFLRLRHGKAYSHGLTNPTNNYTVMYQAGHTAISAWANAVNSAMLAEAFRISGHKRLMQVYTDSAAVAFNYAKNLDDQMLSARHSIGEGFISGQDMKMTAAAFLYNLTGNTEYETYMKDNTIISGPTSSVLHYSSGNVAASHNQLYGIAAYLSTPHQINHPDLYENMKAAVINQAINAEANLSNNRPSRRSTDNSMGYFQTIQNVHRSIVAHRFANHPATKQQLYNTLTLEADWGLGRNPLNIIQMTTATTPLAGKRSIENCYTSGRNDGTPGLHPGHTPYLNMDCWNPGMVMGCPPRMHEFSYPGGVNSWPRAELYYNTRFVWAHSEFTPQQTMRGKAALYGYLYGLANNSVPQIPPGDASDPFSEYYKISGRTDFDRPGGPVIYYAGSYIHVRFEGTSLQATFRDIDSFVNQDIGFIINNQQPVYKNLPKNTTATFEIATNLQDTIHDLYIFKLNNPGGNSFGLQFQGLILDEGKAIFPGDDHYNLKLEFYGDSFTAGSESGPNGEDNGWYSFANVCARILNADIHNNGIGGLAVMDNTGWYQDQTIGFETTFNKLDPGPHNDGGFSEYDFSQFTPDILIFGFGINDNFGGNNPFDDPETWKETYKDLIKAIADIHGKEDVQIIVHPANIFNLVYQYGPEVVQELREEGYDAYWFRFSFDIDAHPTMEEAQQMGEELAAFIQQTMRSVGIRSVNLNKTVLQMDLNQSETLTATIRPVNTTFSKDVYWISDDESIATVDENGTVTGVTAGATTVRVFTVEGNKTHGCWVSVSGTTGIKLHDEQEIKIVPNPNDGRRFQIGFSSPVKHPISVKIICADGKVHYNKNISNLEITEFMIDTNLKSGIYFIRITGTDINERRKLVVI